MSYLTTLRFFWLLVSLLFLLVLTPVVERFGFGEISGRVIFTLLLLAAINVAGNNKNLLIVAVCLGVPWALLSWYAEFSANQSIMIVPRIVLMLLLLSMVIGIVLTEITCAKESNFDLLCGAVAVYLLIGANWAFLYQLIEILEPGSFALLEPVSGASFSQFLYLSMTTLTTLGYGDITPLSMISAIWCTLEAAAGTLYIGLLIARLVALLRD